MPYLLSHIEAATRGVPYKKEFLKILQNSQENTCVRVTFLIKLHAEACNFIKKETMAQVFSCEFYEIFKNTSFTEHLRPTTSGHIFYFCRSYMSAIFILIVKIRFSTIDLL